jgi:hypothetical protein
MADVPGIITGSYLQADALKKKAQVDRQIAEANRQFAEYQAEDAIERGKETERNFRLGVKKAIGGTRVNLAAQGIDIASGSALEIQEDMAALAEVDAITIKNNARREAFGYKTQALNIQAQSNINYNTAQAMRYNTLLTGGVNVVSKVGAAGVDYGYPAGSPGKL